MNGVRIGKVLTVVPHRLILQVLPVGLTACAVVVTGAALPGTVARQIVAAARLATVTSTSGSALSSPNNDFLFRVIHSYS